jgi:hypothetical protein
MSDFLENLFSLDPLAFAFLAGSLLTLWVIWRLLSDPLDLSSPPGDETGDDPTDGDAPPRDESETTEGPPAPRDRGPNARGRGRAA